MLRGAPGDLIGGVVGGLLVLMLILLLLIVVVVVCVRRRAQGKTIQDTHSQGKHLLNMEVYTTHTACLLNYTVVYFTSRSECFLLACS